MLWKCPFPLLLNSLIEVGRLELLRYGVALVLGMCRYCVSKLVYRNVQFGAQTDASYHFDGMYICSIDLGKGQQSTLELRQPVPSSWLSLSSLDVVF